jgi:hypothetical protein
MRCHALRVKKTEQKSPRLLRMLVDFFYFLGFWCLDLAWVPLYGTRGFVSFFIFLEKTKQKSVVPLKSLCLQGCSGRQMYALYN